jgi:ABC-type arginine transport system ATPase subunit
LEIEPQLVTEPVGATRSTLVRRSSSLLEGLKTKELKISGQTFPFTEQLKMTAQDGRSRLTPPKNPTEPEK